MRKFTEGMTKEQKIAYFNEAHSTKPRDLQIATSCCHIEGYIRIMPEDCYGRSVDIHYTQIDDLIQELLECKKYYQKLGKIRKKILTNLK
jgi:hypothetical protein